ncbi:unnamed protein product [Urochloa decumbens]|uniref:Uncharacterized protein n=1 Tax=Urochloa decumbens TaxID=240449 RepID=A0ABC9BP84_9POAL
MAMAGSLLLPWVEGLVGKAADALVQRVTSMWGADGDRHKLERQLEYVRSLLADAEEKAEAKTEAGRAVKAWMKKLKAAAYEADDVLDDFQYEALRRDAQSGESTSRKALYFSRDRIVFHHKASRDLKNVLDKIDELVAEMNTFGLLERAEAPQILYQQTHSSLDESLDIFGRDDDKEVVVKLLLDQQHQRNVQATAVVRSVIELATNGRCDLPENIELLGGKLQETIGRKRFLLVLDDVWNEERHKWEDDLKPLLCSSNGGSGSMILVTSRSRQVAAIMGTLEPHELTCLSEDDSWKLFAKKAFSKGVQEQPELVIIGKHIVNRCKGLPLALKSMGGLMSSKPRVQQWEDIAKSNLGMAALRNLEHLYLLRCESLERMPPKLSLLHNLRTLTTFIVDTKDGRGIEELKDQRQLGNRLELYNLGKVKTGSKVNIHEKRNLSELLLHWGCNLSFNLASEDVSNAEQVLESLAPHGELQILEIKSYRGPTISQWMRDPGMFKCIKKLRISTCPRCMELPIVWFSSTLEELILSDMNSLTTLCNNVDIEGAGFNSRLQIFPRLNIMELWSLPELERWAENTAGGPIMSVMFPLLKKLTILDCPKLARLPECPVLTLLCCTSWSKVFGRVSMPVAAPVSMPLGFCPSLVHLEVGVLADVVMPLENQQNHSQRPLDTLRSLKIQHDDGFTSIFKQSEFQLRLEDCFPILERLEFESCYSIVHWPVEELRCLPSLRSLYLLRCSKLEGKGSSSEETLPLPQLEKLQIASCDSLLEIPMLPTSLEEMGIELCGSLMALPSNLGNLANLRGLQLIHCDGLKVLPDGIDGLSSLEKLRIKAELMKPVDAQCTVCFSNPYSQLSSL